MFKLKWLLLFLALVTQSEASVAQIRFGGLTCFDRLHQATFGLAPLDAVRDAYVAQYLTNAGHFFELGKRFRALSQGIYRSYYPDLKIIADMIMHADSTSLGRRSAFHVGISSMWLRTVERPLQAWSVRILYNPTEYETPNALLEYELLHTDGSKSYVYSYREGEKKVDLQGRDRRDLVNVFVISNGPNEVETVISTVEGNPLDGGPSIIPTVRETAAYKAEILAIKDQLREKPTVTQTVQVDGE